MLVETVLGNVNEPAWTERLREAKVDDLVLDQWDAQKSRLRRTTSLGTELALSLARGVRLRDGDVLAWDDATATAVVARIALGEVMVVHLDTLHGESMDMVIRSAVELGHAIGNQHWPAVVKGTKMYVPLTVDRKVMDSVMRTHAFTGLTHEFIPGTEIIAYLAPHESRRLFGGADSTPHTHLPADLN
ncbi:urease accessory protein UreE [Micromonospora tulbaghiae]|uniref:Urease accessory protein UreE n=1 Tax=Micromonospora tulbaghiae TaxID=479978 RepID=A0ABY0KM36_9ACTN|nr:urease accessory protein UreE [Micromonospora tulbaghiae]MDX5457729.1 urease accessory protein UreE [Micromonospora tulbaghiae]SCE88753.1 urease accessory protein [Micromonospora tulbaghiae]